MEAVILAIASAAMLAASGIAAKKALTAKATPYAAFTAFLAATPILWLIAIATHSQMPSTAGITLQLIRGIIDPGITALLVYAAFKKLGVTLTIPVISAYPIISTILAFTFLKEPLTLPIAAGTIIIIAGAALLTFKNKGSKENMKFIYLAITAAVLIGMAATISKQALNISNQPITGIAISFTAATAAQAAIITALRKWKETRTPAGTTALIALSGTLAAAGFLLNYKALSTGLSIIVQPLTGTQPIFALILSAILLRKHESITRNTITGTFLIVAGAAMLAL